MKSFDDVLNQYDRGTLTRRQLVQGLFMLAMPAVAGAQAAAPADPLRARTINHVHIVVNDYEESKAFYGALLGAKFQHEFGPTIHSVVLPGDQPNGAWLSLDSGTSQTDKEKKNKLGHFAIGIDRFDANETKAAINKSMPDLKVEVAGDKRSCFVFDPNGIRVQLMAKEDKGA
jgi:catechol 2,3-dioxygenase-like lactoylglutathione lyase family enzyme